MLRLRVYLSNPQGERQHKLPVLKDSLQYAHPLNGSAVLKFAMSAREAGRMPEKGFIVTVEYKWGTGDYQALPEHGQFFMTKASGDDADQSKVVTFEGETYLTWLLARTHLHWSSSAKNNERVWVEPGDKPASSGWIMHGMLTESQGRGWGSQVSWDFTGAVDSKGAAWTAAEKVKQGWRLLDPLSSVLGALSESGLCDWTTDTRTGLRLFRTGTLGSDRSQWVLGGPRMSKVPIKTDASGIFTHLTVVPEKAKNWLYLTNPGAPTEHGRLEATMTQSGIESHSEATRLAQPALKLGRAASREESYEWTPDGDLAPWAHFRVGDMVTVRVQGLLIQRRVIAIIVEERGGVMTARVTVGEKIPGMQARILGLIGAGHVGSIIGGSGKAFPGSTGPLKPEPARVEGLLVVNDVARWTEDGKLLSEVTLGWDPVVYAVDGTAIDLTGYELWARKAGEARYRVTSSGDTEVTTTAFEPGSTQWVSVRAISDQGVPGAFSTEVEVTPQPPEPLDPPTMPIFRTGNGAIQTIWDGMLDDGSGPYPAPVWCSHCLVEVQADGETEWERFPQDSGWVLTGLTRGDKWSVRLVAVDFRGIESEPGPAGEVTVQSEAQDALERANQAAADALEAKQEAEDALAETVELRDTVIPGLDTRLTGEIEAATTAAQDAVDQAVLAKTTADGKNSIYVRPETDPRPQGKTPGDLLYRLFSGQVERLVAPVDDGEFWANVASNGVHYNTVQTWNPELFVDQYGLSLGYPQADPLNVLPLTEELPTTGSTITTVIDYYGDADGLMKIWYKGVSGGYFVLKTVNLPNPNWGDGTVTDTTVLPPNGTYFVTVELDGPFALWLDSISIKQTVGDESYPETAIRSVEIWNGTQWSPHQIVADSLLVPSSIGNVLIKDGAITGPKVNAESVAAVVGEFVEVRASKIVGDQAALNSAFVGQLVSDQGFITNLLTQQIIVAGDNLIRDPAFKKPLAENWAAWEGSFEAWYASSSTWVPGPTLNCDATGSGAKRLVQIARIPVIPGQTLSMSFRAQAGWSGNPWAGSNAQVRVAWRSASGIISTSGLTVTPNTGWRTYTGIVTAPSDETLVEATYEILIPSGATSGLLSVGQLMLRSGVGATLIEPDAVTTPAIKAGSIITDHLSTGALDAFQITSPLIQSVATANRGIKWNGAVLAGYNNSGTETFRLDATRATITAGIFRTTATTNRGIQMDEQFLRAWNASGTETFRVTASTGAVVMTGATVRTAASGARMTFDTTGLKMFGPLGSYPVFQLDGLEQTGPTGDYGITMRAYSGSSTLGVKRIFIGGKYGETGVRMALADASGYERVSIDDQANKGITVSNPGNGGIGNLYGGYLSLTVGGSNTAYLRLSPAPTTTAAANTVIASNPAGVFYRSTSLRKFKKDLRPLSESVDPYQILNVVPQTWLDSGQLEMQAEAEAIAEARAAGVMVIDPDYETFPVTPRRIPGFVAEDMEAAGLGVLCEYDEHGDLQGISYDRVGAALVLALQALLERVETLEAALAA